MATTLEVPDNTSLIQSGDLRIAPLDILQISVFGVEELSGPYQVDYLGRIKLPLIGEIDAKGFTAIELAALLEARLGESYLQDPDVNVIVDESLGQQVTVEGSVTKPGLFPIQGRVSLLQAIAMAEGPSETANPRRVVVFREISGERKAAAFDLVAIRNGEASDPFIYGNDIVVVDGSEARRTYGDFIRSIPLLALFVAL
ncbi:MAG: polysaccharide biosynthesis/export family protein [Pseudomonadota bacterium]